MRNNLWTKGLVIGIILLFVGSSVLPNISGDIDIRSSYFLNQNDILSSSISADDWPMFRHDLSHSGYSTTTAPSTNNILWTYTTGSVITSSPSIVNEKVYICQNWDKIYCLDAKTGIKIWDYAT
jgi:outer membrane protein assembly factor BamB